MKLLLKNYVKIMIKRLKSVDSVNLEGIEIMPRESNTKWVWLLYIRWCGGVGVKADYLKKDLGLKVGCPPWGSF